VLIFIPCPAEYDGEQNKPAMRNHERTCYYKFYYLFFVEKEPDFLLVLGLLGALYEGVDPSFLRLVEEELLLLDEELPDDEELPEDELDELLVRNVPVVPDDLLSSTEEFADPLSVLPVLPFDLLEKLPDRSVVAG